MLDIIHTVMLHFVYRGTVSNSVNGKVNQVRKALNVLRTLTIVADRVSVTVVGNE